MDGMNLPPRRERLPDRRQHFTETVEWIESGETRKADIHVGVDESGRAREIFISISKPGSPVWLMANDSAYFVSVMLQEGRRAAELLGRLMRATPKSAAEAFADADTGVAVPSLIARALDFAVRFERELAEMVEAER